MTKVSRAVQSATGVVLALAFSLAGLPSRADEFTGNDLRDIRVGMAASELHDEGYVGFACAATPDRAISGWSSWRECPAGEDGTRAIRFGFDPQTSREGTRVAGHPVILTLAISKAGQVVGLDIETDPKARLYLRKKAYLLGRQAMLRYGEEGWTCKRDDPGAGEEPVGGVYLKEHCTKTTGGRSLTVDRSLFRRSGENLTSFTDETRISIKLESR
jgi:hypothetical protein